MFQVSIVQATFDEIIQQEIIRLVCRQILFGQSIQAMLHECSVGWHEECVIRTRNMWCHFGIVQKSDEKHEKMI